MKLLLNGYGRMGRMIEDIVSGDPELEIIGKIDPLLPPWTGDAAPEGILDFSLPEGLDTSLSLARKYNCPLLIGTTGLSDEAKQKIQALSRLVPVMAEQIETCCRRGLILKNIRKVTLDNVRYEGVDCEWIDAENTEEIIEK